MNKLFSLFLIVGLSACGSSSTSFQSQANNGEMKIDGEYTDWQESQLVLEEGFNLGVRNDDENLFLSVTITDMSLRQAVQVRGLLIWLGEDENGDKINGVKYPVGLRAGQGRQARTRDQGAGQGRNRENRQAMLEESMSKIEFLSDATMGREMKVSEQPHVKVAWAVSQDELFYEMSIPLSSPIAQIVDLNKNPGDKLSVLVELPQLQRPDGAQARRRGGQGGGRGRGARQGGRRGQGGGQGRAAMTVELKKSVVVTLAK